MEVDEKTSICNIFPSFVHSIIMDCWNERFYLELSENWVLKILLTLDLDALTHFDSHLFTEMSVQYNWDLNLCVRGIFVFFFETIYLFQRKMWKRLHLSEPICELKTRSVIQPKFGKRTNFIPGKRVSTKVLQSGKRIYGHSNPFIVNRKDRPIASTMHMNWKALTNSQKS